MEKIKINTTSGAVLEKPLVTAFKLESGEYVVVDNEMNGTMGLPIILVSKLVNNTLSLITDAEWGSVKEALRLIISGNEMNYIRVNETVSAEDVFFKQLTLPLASFEALKNNYKSVVLASTESFAAETTPVEPVNDMVLNVEETVTPEPVAPVEVPNEVVSEVQMPEVNVTPIEPIMPAVPVESQVVAPVTSFEEVAPAPTVEPIPAEEPAAPVDFTADKEAFLKACENMFDALVAKFNK